MSAKHRPVTVQRDDSGCTRPDRPVATVGEDVLTIVAPAPAHTGWRTAAILYGGPWTAAVVVASVWYLGWGFPDGFWYRLLIWVVLMLLTAALHAIAFLTFWGTVYARSGVETLTIDPARITVRRQAGRVPIGLHIPRHSIESARSLPAHPGGRPHPRIEITAWRSAIRLGAGMTGAQAAECVEVLTAFFEREEYVRALTPAPEGDTIAATRAGRLAGTTMATTGTSRTDTGLIKRAGTVGARVARRFRRSP